jgi:type II secretory pathway component PulL
MKIFIYYIKELEEIMKLYESIPSEMDLFDFSGRENRLNLFMEQSFVKYDKLRKQINYYRTLYNF